MEARSLAFFFISLTMGFMYKSIMEFMRKVGWVMVVVMGFYCANVNSLPFLNSQTYMKAHFLPFFKIS